MSLDISPGEEATPGEFSGLSLLELVSRSFKWFPHYHALRVIFKIPLPSSRVCLEVCIVVCDNC